MSLTPDLSDLSRLYQTEFVRSARAVGVLWAVCTLCFAIIQVVVLVQPSWVGTTERHQQGAGPAPPSGTLGLFEVCLESDWPVPECHGSLSTLSPLPSFQSVAVLVGVSLWAVWTSVICLCLFRFCSAATVYKICAWLQLTAGFCLALACLLFPDSWESPEMRALCGDSVRSFMTSSNHNTLPCTFPLFFLCQTVSLISFCSQSIFILLSSVLFPAHLSSSPSLPRSCHLHEYLKAIGPVQGFHE
ncbi:LHFPL tetraspan subfamily member 3 protein isoform 1-T1 [Synchiropus picturatus]